ncbi:MAG: hypothetical protein M3525_00485 [Acidobacteriota bacterium]|nr:hypothetical protein [Acidobacteriota bacterium]
MTTPNQSNDNQTPQDENKQKDASNENTEPKNNTPTMSGDPGRTPGSAEGDEETVDEDIRQKEAEGKL